MPFTYFITAGTCWAMMSNNGRCTEILYEKSNKEKCCDSDSVSTAWSADDLDSGSLFFWRVLGGGVFCVSCKGRSPFILKIGVCSQFYLYFYIFINKHQQFNMRKN